MIVIMLTYRYPPQPLVTSKAVAAASVPELPLTSLAGCAVVARDLMMRVSLTLVSSIRWPVLKST